MTFLFTHTHTFFFKKWLLSWLGDEKLFDRKVKAKKLIY